MSRWFDDDGNVVELGRWLAFDEGWNGEELQGYYEKPWKWDDEWERYRQWARKRDMHNE